MSFSHDPKPKNDPPPMSPGSTSGGGGDEPPDKFEDLNAPSVGDDLRKEYQEQHPPEVQEQQNAMVADVEPQKANTPSPEPAPQPAPDPGPDR